jgi:hypothetical protein
MARRAVAYGEAKMWRREHEYSLELLLNHPVLGVVMTSTGMDRRAVELLLETERVRQPESERFDDGPRVSAD